MGALYDGNHYMVERFHNVLFTPESYGHMTDSPLQSGTPPSALAMGLSKSYGGLPRCPASFPSSTPWSTIPPIPHRTAPCRESCCPTSSSRWPRLKSELGAGKGFSVVHIASHFVLIAGSGDEPFLMMGGDNTGDPSGFPGTSPRWRTPRRLSRHAPAHSLGLQHGQGLQIARTASRWTRSAWLPSRKMPKPCWPRFGT
jgi:hypothetical protein